MERYINDLIIKLIMIMKVKRGFISKLSVNNFPMYSSWEKEVI